MLVDPSAFASHADHGTLLVTLALLAGLGLVLVWRGGLGLWRAHVLAQRGVHVPAAVVPAAGYDVHGRLFQDVVYEVPAPEEGRTLALVSVGPHLHRHRPGTQAPVVYEPGHPERSRADDPGRILGPAAVLALGLGSWAAALAWVVPNL